MLFLLGAFLGRGSVVGAARFPGRDVSLWVSDCASAGTVAVGSVALAVAAAGYGPSLAAVRNGKSGDATVGAIADVLASLGAAWSEFDKCPGRASRFEAGASRRAVGIA